MNATQDPARPHVTWYTPDPRDARIAELEAALEVVTSMAEARSSTITNLTRSCEQLRDMYHKCEKARQEEAVFARGFVETRMEIIDERNRRIAELEAALSEVKDWAIDDGIWMRARLRHIIHIADDALAGAEPEPTATTFEELAI